MNNKKIIKYPKALNINIGVIIFFIIFIYLLFNVYTYMTSKHVSYYEVDEGSIRIKTTYTGLALRQEQLIYSNKDGYVNYYLKDNSRAKNGSLICSVDENGDIASQIRNTKNTDHSLNTDAYRMLIEEMKDYSNSYSDMTFYNSYTFKNDLKAELMEAVNLSALNSMSEYAANAEASNSFHLLYASQPGIVTYYSDGYESVTIDNFTPGMLDESSYEKTNLKAADKVNSGEPLYKLITSEQWHVVFAIDQTLKELLQDDSVIRVRFKSDETTAWSNYEIRSKGNENYLILSFNNSMIRYASERFIDVELMMDKQEGLKIPNTAIVSKNFYEVPQNYFTRGGAASSYGLLIDTTDDQGTKVQRFIATDIYYSTEDSYYISEAGITKGTKVISPDGGESMIISDNANLNGVYNINKGYAVFRIIDIRYQNEEYAIIARNTSYGLSQYDHIALDGTIISEDEIINQ